MYVVARCTLGAFKVPIMRGMIRLKSYVRNYIVITVRKLFYTYESVEYTCVVMMSNNIWNRVIDSSEIDYNNKNALCCRDQTKWCSQSCTYI